MVKTTVNPLTLFNSLQFGFSQVVVAPAGKTLHLSGQVAWDADQNIVGAKDLGAQMAQSMNNVELALQAAGGSLDDIVSMRIYIVAEAMDDSHHISEILRQLFTPKTAPATTWIGVYSLARPEFLVEVEAVAVLGS